ncbi:MAG: hypothetical protein JNM17_13955, partial [Archangium sp.]|nr:hypothetical protein [Archangium sp.]
PANCLGLTDCNDNNAMQYRMASVRVDSDGDGYCTAAPAVMQCIGNSAPSGYALTCNATTDCRDSNPFATTNCNLALESPHVAKSCGGGNPPSTTSPVYVGCPQGFTSTMAYSLGNNALITCTHVFNPGNSNINVTATCNAGPVSTSGECWVSVTCTAN